MRNKWLTILVAFVLLLAACQAPVEGPAAETPEQPAAPEQPAPTPITGGTEAPATVLTDMMGRQVTVRGVPQRIVSLSPAATEILFALSAQGNIVAVDEGSDYPEEAAAIQKVSADAAAILALTPDMVFVSRDFPQEAADRLTAENIPVVCAEAATYSDVYAGIALTAQILRADASKLVEGMQQTVQEVNASAAELDRQPTVLFVLGYQDGKATAAGTNSLAFSLIELAGGIPVTSSAETFPSYSAQDISVLAPDVVLVSSDVDLETITAAPGFSELPAVQEGRAYSIDSTLTGRPGPRIVEGIREVYEALELSLVS
ncbi:MAG TPA: ABC transporter substrate-binding protein [Feifaniaceae bacterium]|nr:ABC transporter substrate-binding protein [Feifaniaceae bacterium]